VKSPTPYSHLYRLALVLAGAAALFILLVVIFIPKSWNFDMANWYRLDSLKEMQAQPMIYGGIESLKTSKRNITCVECHKDLVKEYKRLGHKKVSCEACHGALRDHAVGTEKIAAAPIDKTTWQCLNCHENLVNKPIQFPRFRDEEKYAKHREFLAGKLPPETTCLKCHSPHDPKP